VQAVGEDLGALGTDLIMDPCAFFGYHDPGRAQIAGVLHAADEAALVQGLDDAGQHRGVQALELGQLRQAQGAPDVDQGKHGVLRRSEVRACGRVVEHAGEPGDDRTQPDHEFGVHHILRDQLECLLASN
jgi:hypothetical protein